MSLTIKNIINQLTEFNDQKDMTIQNMQKKYNDLEKEYQKLKNNSNNNLDKKYKELEQEYQKLKKTASTKDIISEVIKTLSDNNLLSIFNQDENSINISDKTFENKILLKDYTELSRTYDNLVNEFDELNIAHNKMTEINQELNHKLNYYERENKQLKSSINRLKEFTNNGYFIDYECFVRIINSLYANDLNQLADDLIMKVKKQHK